MIIKNHIHVNPFSRPGKKLQSRSKTVWHYTANPGASDEAHVGYFDGLRFQDPNDNKPDRYASAHIFIDKDSAREIIPLDEMAYHAGNTWYNLNSIGVELCIEKDGTFHPNTIAQAIEVGVYLAKTFGQDPLKDFIRHYDIEQVSETGKRWRKICPKPWVDKPADWEQFKKNVHARLNEKPKSQLEKDLEVLQKYGIVNSPDYWEVCAQKGKQADGEFVAILINRMAKELLKRG